MAVSPITCRRFIQEAGAAAAAMALLPPEEGVRFTRGFVTNSIYGPSRAVLRRGKYSYVNGFEDDFSSSRTSRSRSRRRSPTTRCPRRRRW